MEHSHGGLDLGSDMSTVALWLRLALLLTTALVAGAGLVRPQVAALPRRVTVFAFACAAAAALLVVASVVAVDVNIYGAAAHVVLVAAVPLLLGKPRISRWASVALVLLLVVETTVGGSRGQLVLDTVYVTASVAWFGLAVLAFAGPTANLRLWPLALTLGVVLVVAGAVRLVLSGVAFDRRIYESGLGLALLAVVVLPLATTLLVRSGSAGRVYRYAAASTALALVTWSASAAIPVPPELPVPGVPVLVETTLAGQRVPVLISPHRPGHNLVHVPASAGYHIQVSVAGGPPVPAVPRAGAEGAWAEVELPAGRGEVVLNSGTQTASVDVDPGEQPGPALDADGPECASAALGSLLAGHREVLTSCPADALSTEDEDALRRLVTFLRSRGAAGITLAQDTSPRSVKAAAVVREAAGTAGLRIDPEQRPDNALVTVSGWSAAHAALATAGTQQAESPVYAHGLYLAPWLLSTPLVTAVTTVSVPLRFDPREQSPVNYAVAVGNGFGGENPTPAGFHAWLGSHHSAVDSGVQIYAVAQVTAMPMGPNEVHAPGMPMTEEMAGQWIPKATVVPVSALLLG